MGFWRKFRDEAVADWKADVQPEIDRAVAHTKAYLQERKRQRLRLKVLAAISQWPIIYVADGQLVREVCNAISREADVTNSRIAVETRRAR